MDKDDRLIDVNAVLARAKQVLGFRTDVQLANYLGVARSTLCNWSARHSMDYPLILFKLKGIDYNWLLTGKGHPQPSDTYCESELASGQVEILHHPRTTDPHDERSIPLYDIDAAANLRTILSNAPQYCLGNIHIPDAPRCDGALRVNGDSMSPLLKSGDIIAFCHVTDLQQLIYGEMYLVSYTLDGEDYLVVKYIKRSKQAGCIRLVSANPRHAPMDLPVKCITALAIVKLTISRNSKD